MTDITLKAIRNTVLVDIYDTGEGYIEFEGGHRLITLGDSEFGMEDFRTQTVQDTKHTGIRPRWAIVLAVSEEAKQAGISVGDKVLCDTMKWTRGVEYDSVNHRKCWRINYDDILGVDETGMSEYEQNVVNQ